MSGNVVRKIKLFWTDQDDKQEQWLRAMAAKGLHLTKVSNSWLWTFRQGAPADIAYRLDFNKNGGEADYRQLILDGGWELAAEADHWQYWRKAVIDGKVPAIFTDHESRLQMYERVLKRFALLLILCWFGLPTRDSSFFDQKFWPVGLIIYFGVAAMAYATVRLMRRMRAIKRTALESSQGAKA